MYFAIIIVSCRAAVDSGVFVNLHVLTALVSSRRYVTCFKLSEETLRDFCRNFTRRGTITVVIGSSKSPEQIDFFGDSSGGDVSHSVNLKLKADFLLRLQRFCGVDMEPATSIMNSRARKNQDPDELPLNATTGSTQSSVLALVKVIDTDSGESKLVLDDEALTVIRSIEGPISVIAIAGAYR